MSNRLPIFVLAGSDVSPDDTPRKLQPTDALAGPKGTIQLGSGRCLAAELVERIRNSECFTDPLLVGPRDWYDGKVDCELIPVEGSLVQTLRQLVKTVTDRLDVQQPFAVATCDILPSGNDFRRLLENDYAPHAESLFWWQMIEAERERMGASAWKPSYRLPLGVGQTPRQLYPGHLVIARAHALRFPLMNRLLELAYRSRNRVLEKRYLGVTIGAIGTLLAQDLRNVLRRQLPVLTLGVPYRGLRGYVRYRRGTATLRDVEDFLTHAFLHRRCHGLSGGRPLVISVSSLVAFAKDIDTKAELEELQLR